MPHPFTLSQGAPHKQLSSPAAASSLAPECSPRPKRQHPSPDTVDDMPVGRTTSKATSEGPPSSKQQEVPPWVQGTQTEPLRSIQLGYQSSEGGLGRSTLRDTSPTSPWMACMICQRSSGIWPRPQSYLVWPFIEIKEVWKRPDELQQANYTLMSLLKGLKFL